MTSSHAQRTVTPFRTSRLRASPFRSRTLFSLALLKARAAELRRSLWISLALENTMEDVKKCDGSLLMAEIQ